MKFYKALFTYVFVASLLYINSAAESLIGQKSEHGYHVPQDISVENLSQFAINLKLYLEHIFSDFFYHNANSGIQLVPSDGFQVTVNYPDNIYQWYIEIPPFMIRFTELPIDIGLGFFEPVTLQLEIDDQLWYFRYDLPKEIGVYVYHLSDRQWVHSGYQFSIEEHELAATFDFGASIWRESFYRAADVELVHLSPTTFRFSPDYNLLSLVFSIEELIYEARGENAHETNLYHSENSFSILNWHIQALGKKPWGYSYADFHFDALEINYQGGDFPANYLPLFSRCEFRDALYRNLLAPNLTAVQLCRSDDELLNAMLEFIHNLQELEIYSQLSGLEYELMDSLEEGRFDITTFELDEAALQLNVQSNRDDIADSQINLHYDNLLYMQERSVEGDSAGYSHSWLTGLLAVLPSQLDISGQIHNIPARFMPLDTRLFIAQPEQAFSDWVETAKRSLVEAGTNFELGTIFAESPLGGLEFQGELAYAPQARFGVIGSLEGQMGSLENYIAFLEEIGFYPYHLVVLFLFYQMGEEQASEVYRSYKFDFTQEGLTINGEHLRF